MRLRGFVLSLALLASGCQLGMAWQNHASFRSMGKELRLAHIDPSEVVRGAVSANLHYITVAIDTVFVRNLPGLFDRSVALGLELTGILPGGKAIKTVLDVKKGVGEHAFLSFDNVAVIQPFLYTGQNLTITLHFRAVPKDQLTHLKGRIAGAGDLVKRINPAKYAALETGVDLFQSTIGAFMKKELSWKYQFTLYPPDSVYRDKPEMLLTAARHILMLRPPSSASDDLAKFQPSKVMRYLKMRGNRLVWVHSDKEYTETPYIVLNITRFKRYPNPDTELRKIATKTDEFIEQGNLASAKAMLHQLGAAIVKDPIITSMEKNLERSRKDYREARILVLEARKTGDKARELRGIENQIRHLSHIRTQFWKILYPYEVKDIDFQVSQLALRADLIGRETGIAVAGIKKLAKAYRLAAAKLVEPPPPPKPKLPAKLVKLDLKKQPPPPVPSWKKLYQKWWFWTLVSVGAAGVGAATYAVTRPGKVIPAPGVEIPFAPALTGR